MLPDLIHTLLGSMRFPTMTRMLLYYRLSWFNLMWTRLWYVMSREMMNYCFWVCPWGSLEKTSLSIGGLGNGHDFPHSVYARSYQPRAQIIKKKLTVGKFIPCIVVFLVLRNLEQTWLNYISSCLVLDIEKVGTGKSVSIPQTYKVCSYRELWLIHKPLVVT